MSNSKTKTICFTNNKGGSGKSTACANLAYELSKAGKKVLLIDADLRKSVLVGRYKIGAIDAGLTNYLAGQAELDEALHETNVENILIDFMEKHIQSIEYKKMLVRTSGVLLDLYIKGETEDDSQNINHTIKAIDDFLTTAVYN